MVDDAAVEYVLQFRRYRLPLRVPLQSAHGVWKDREGFILRLEDAAGRVGFGEVSTLPWFGTEKPDEVEEVCRDLGVRTDDDVLARIPRDLGCLRHALASARAELAQTEARWEDNEFKPLPVAALLPSGRSVLGRIPSLVEAGFRTFKWKVGVGELADELALLDDVCALLPEGAKLRLDANGGWNRRQAERWLTQAAERPVEFVEQPCFAGIPADERQRRDVEDLLLGLASDYPTAIALDESLVGDRDLAHWLALGWTGVYVLKPSLCGDVEDVIAKLERAKAAVVFSSALETPVGARVALGHAFRWRGSVRALGFGVWPLFADRRFDGPVTVPFLRWQNVKQIDPVDTWNALK